MFVHVCDGFVFLESLRTFVYWLRRVKNKVIKAVTVRRALPVRVKPHRESLWTGI